MMLGALFSGAALAAPVNGEVLNARFGDIEQAIAASPGLVAVPQEVGITEAKGGWAFQDGQSIWTYRIRVPEASLLAVVITRLRLPAGGSLTVTGADGSSETLVAGGEDLITRLMPTEAVTLTARVTDADGFAIRINSLQVGARKRLPAGSAKHASGDSQPLALALHPSCATNPASANCRQSRRRNASCDVDAGNYLEARSSIGLVINRPNGTNADGSTRFDASSCSGNLVNDTASSGKGYITTARHCGLKDAGSNPTATALAPGTRFKIYWNRRADCGSSDYDITPFFLLAGRTTETSDIQVRSVSAQVDYQGLAYNTDGLLLEVTSAIPDGANPYWAGVDATLPAVSHGEVDSSIVSPFGVSHPAGFAASLARSTDPVYYGLPNQSRCRVGNLVSSCMSYEVRYSEGDVTDGSSGSGLLDANRRVRGVLSEGSASGDSISTYFGLGFGWSPTLGGAPVSWNFKQFLDAANTGRRITDGRNDLSRADNINVWLGSPQVDQNIGSYTVRYVTDNAVSCSAFSDPVQPDWNGFKPVSNGANRVSTFTVTHNGPQILSLSCSNSSGRSSTANLLLVGVVGGTASDQDADGIADVSDACPTQSGPASNSGCPLPADADGDGLADDSDECPTVAGPRANGGCPTVNDPDGDGSDGANDLCPNAPGPASNNGCPLTSPDDQDGDGVPDAQDRCHLSFGPVSNNGCPISQAGGGKKGGGALDAALLLLAALGTLARLRCRRHSFADC